MGLKIKPDVKLRFNKGLAFDAFKEIDSVIDGFAEEVIDRAKSDHEWRDITGETTKAMSWDRRKNVVALKVRKGPGFWMELGFTHSKSGQVIRKPGLTKAFDAMKDKLAGRLKDVVR